MAWIVQSPGVECCGAARDSRRAPRVAAHRANCLTVREHCAPGLVAGRYQPLADDVTIAGDVRPNLSSAVDSEDKGNRTCREIRFPPPSAKVLRFQLVRRRPPPNPPAFATGNRRALPAISGVISLPL